MTTVNVAAGLRHGTSSAYGRYHCRCDACREYQRERNARNRAAQLADGRLSHGTQSAYCAGCRCEPCRLARREAYLRRERGGPDSSQAVIAIRKALISALMAQ